MPVLRDRRLPPASTSVLLLPLVALAFVVAACGQALVGAAPADAATPTTIPTTTYSPSGSAALPSTAPAATPGAATTPTSAATTPAATAPASATTTPGAVTTPSTPGAAHPAAASKGDAGLSSGAIVIAALAALLILVCAAWGLARRSAFEPHWLISARHAMAEAGFRASATWSEFTDWVRLGR